MTSVQLTVKHLFAITICLAAGAASACKLSPDAYDLAAFLRAPGDSKVVFLGKVLSVREYRISEDLTEQKIRFETSRWWRGTGEQSVLAKGVVGLLKGTDCAGVFDFSVKQGEEWLIVGYVEKGEIRPSHLLSIPTSSGKLPDDTLTLLENSR